MPGTEAPRWRFLITPKWLAWHLTMVVSVCGMLWLGDWQFHRAISGNGLSWAYTFEWPIFAVFAVVFWAKTIKDEFHPPAVAQAGAHDVPLPAGALRQGGPDGAAVPAGEPGLPGGGGGPRRVQRLPRPPAPGSEGPRQVARPAVARDGNPGDNAKEVARLRLNVTLYRVMAYVTGVILIVLCVFAIAQAFTNDEAIVNAIGTVHGLLYIVYLIVSYPLTRRLRLPVWPTVAVLLAGTIPVMTFVVERRISHRYIEPALADVTVRLPDRHGSFSPSPQR